MLWICFGFKNCFILFDLEFISKVMVYEGFYLECYLVLLMEIYVKCMKRVMFNF